MTPLVLPTKALRAQVIRGWMRRYAQPRRVVCFTCGHAADELRRVGLDVLQIGGPGADLQPGRWWSQDEIARWFPDCFDATSGHLPDSIMGEVSGALADWLASSKRAPKRGVDYAVRCGSGESLVLLARAYPWARLHAVYDQADPATTWHPLAPLNTKVVALAMTRTILNPEHPT